MKIFHDYSYINEIFLHNIFVEIFVISDKIFNAFTNNFFFLSATIIFLMVQQIIIYIYMYTKVYATVLNNEYVKLVHYLINWQWIESGEIYHIVMAAIFIFGRKTYLYSGISIILFSLYFGIEIIIKFANQSIASHRIFYK